MNNEEIKEILEFDFESQGERIVINEYERDILKDYITNLQEKLQDIKDYVNFLVIFNQNINGKFSETQWGQDILDLIGSDNNE